MGGAILSRVFKVAHIGKRLRKTADNDDDPLKASTSPWVATLMMMITLIICSMERRKLRLGRIS